MFARFCVALAPWWICMTWMREGWRLLEWRRMFCTAALETRSHVLAHYSLLTLLPSPKRERMDSAAFTESPTSPTPPITEMPRLERVQHSRCDARTVKRVPLQGMIDPANFTVLLDPFLSHTHTPSLR